MPGLFLKLLKGRNKPAAIIAKTFKGRGIPNVEDAENWHGKALPKERGDEIIRLIESQIQTNRNLLPKPPVEGSPPVSITNIKMTCLPDYKVGDRVVYQKAYGLALLNWALQMKELLSWMVTQRTLPVLKYSRKNILSALY